MSTTRASLLVSSKLAPAPGSGSASGLQGPDSPPLPPFCFLHSFICEFRIKFMFVGGIEDKNGREILHKIVD